MDQTLNSRICAVQQGIKIVGVGKKGSRELPDELIEAIADELARQDAPDIAVGALLAGLWMKGVSADEQRIGAVCSPSFFESAECLIDYICHDINYEIRQLMDILADRRSLNQAQAERLGAFLLGNVPGDRARGFAASLLRVRYETDDEYAGLLRAMEATFNEPFKRPLPAGKPVLTLAEPFDGVDRSNMITPLVADQCQQLGFRVVTLAGRNSGPKFGNNVCDIHRQLGSRFLTSSDQLTDDIIPYGHVLDQADLSTALDRWVDYRHTIIKRPFLATLERFVDPFSSDLLVASAFHPPYGEKMLRICERAGFSGAVIVRNGMEGTMAFPLMRAAKVLCSAVQADGSYRRHEFEVNARDFGIPSFQVEERIEQPDLGKNVDLIQRYYKEGQTGYDLFDSRVKVTCAGLQKAIKWVLDHRVKPDKIS